MKGCGKEKGGSGGQLIPRLESAHRYQSRCTASARHQISTGRTLDKLHLFTSDRLSPNVTQTQGLCSEDRQALGGYFSHMVYTPFFSYHTPKGRPFALHVDQAQSEFSGRKMIPSMWGVGVWEMVLTGGQQHPNPIGEVGGLVSCELLML